jgi:integrase
VVCSTSCTTTFPVRLRFSDAVGSTRAYHGSDLRITFGKYATEWLASQYELARADLIRANTICRFESALAVHLLPFFGAVDLDHIGRQRCEAFRTTLFASQQLAPRTINGVMAILRLILRRAIQDGAMTVPDPTVGIRPLFAAPRRVDCYTSEELGRLLEATPARWRALVALAGLAGLRQGEILALRRDNIDLDSHVIHVRRSLQRSHRLLTLEQRMGPPKSPAASRDVPVRARLASILSEHLAEYWRPNLYELAFPGRRGHPLYPANFCRRVYQPAIAAAGLRSLSFHDLRVTFITHCAEAGVPIATIARWVGHTQTKTTELYWSATTTAEAGALQLLTKYDASYTGKNGGHC